MTRSMVYSWLPLLDGERLWKVGTQVKRLSQFRRREDCGLAQGKTVAWPRVMVQKIRRNKNWDIF